MTSLACRVEWDSAVLQVVNTHLQSPDEQQYEQILIKCSEICFRDQ